MCNTCIIARESYLKARELLDNNYISATKPIFDAYKQARDKLSKDANYIRLIQSAYDKYIVEILPHQDSYYAALDKNTSKFNEIIKKCKFTAK